MTVDDLRDLLDDLLDCGAGDRELMFVYQSNYPLQDHVACVWDPENGIVEDEDDPPARRSTHNKDGVPYVYLVSGGQNHRKPYGPREAFDEC